jgi:hypothetical protein
MIPHFLSAKKMAGCQFMFLDMVDMEIGHTPQAMMKKEEDDTT